MLRVMLIIPFYFLMIVLGISGCSTTEVNESTPEGLLARAWEYEKDDRFEESIRRFQEVRSKFPYSAQALEAELAVADVYFKQESYAESQTAYQSFKELHPKHPKIAYVYYRYALSLYLQLPETIDRDLSLIPDTILAFNDIIQKFPQSEFLNESKEKKSELIKKMAEKEIYVGDFYFKKKTFDSALPRYEYVLKEYRGIGFDEKALVRAAFCAFKIGDPNKTRKYISELKALDIKNNETRSLLKEIKL
jgi:outer membrane protein assembly factor BamD